MNKRTIVAGIFIALISCVAGAYLRFNTIVTPGNDNNGNLGSENSGDIAAKEVVTISGNISILMMGEDNVESSRRSDTVAIINLDIDDRIIRVLSLPRDTRVDIPGHGFQKLNHAYAYGQQDLLRATVERFMGTSINYYIKIDYDSFPSLVDLVGGVDLFVQKPLKYVDRAGKLNINLAAGQQRLDGERALHFVRFRHDALGDIGRIQRQQQFLKALIQKLFEPQNLVRYPTIAEGISNAIQTDLPPSLLLQLGYFLRGLEKEKGRIFFSMLPGKPAMFSNLSYWIGDVSAGIQFLAADYDTLISKDIQERTKKNNPVPTISTAENAPVSLDSDINNAKTGANNTPTTVEKPVLSGVPDPEMVRQIVAKMPEPVAVLNGSGKKGVSQQIAEHLQRMGIDVVYVGNAKHYDYKTTNVIYPLEAQAKSIEAAKLLSQLSGVPSSLTRPNKFASYPSIIVGHDYERIIKRLEKSYASQ